MAFTSLCFCSTEVCTPCIAAWLTTLWMSQVTFPVILLFAFREHERGTALGTRYFKVWHRGFSVRVIEDFHSLALRSAGGAFLSTTGRGAKALFSSNARRKALASRRFIGPECTPAVECIQIFTAVAPRADCGRTSSEVFLLWLARNSYIAETSLYKRHIGCSQYALKHAVNSSKGPDI